MPEACAKKLSVASIRVIKRRRINRSKKTARTRVRFQSAKSNCPTGAPSQGYSSEFGLEMKCNFLTN